MPVMVRMRDAPVAAVTLILSPSVDAEILGKFGADQDVIGQHARLAGDDVVGNAHDLEIDLGVDAGEGDRAAGIAAHRERRRRSWSATRSRCPATSLSWSLIFCHWSIERMRCAGRWTIARHDACLAHARAAAAPPRPAE